jgi:hypothetical protein
MFSHGAFEVLDEDVEPFGGGGPLGLLRGELIGCPADLLDGGVYLVSGGFLLLSREDGVVQHGSCRGHQLADLAGLAGALLGSHDRRVRLVPHPGDDHRDRLGGVHRALGELADLGGDDGEPLARLAGPGGLDGGVQREQVRLRGDVVDQLQDVADLLRALAEGQRPRGDRLDLVLHVAHAMAAFAIACALSAIDPAAVASCTMVADVCATAADCSLVTAAAFLAACRSSPVTSTRIAEVERMRPRRSSRSPSRPSAAVSSCSRRKARPSSRTAKSANAMPAARARMAAVIPMASA